MHEIREYTSRGRLLKKLNMPEGSTATPFDPAALIASFGWLSLRGGFHGHADREVYAFG